MILIGACSASYERARAFISGLECPWQRREDGLKDYGVPFSMQYKRFQNQESGALNFNALSTWGTSLPKLHLLFFFVAALSLPRFLSYKWKGLELYVKDPLVLQVGFSPGSA